MTPYADAALDYFRAGWSPLPIPGKWPPPKGWTGGDGKRPTAADVLAWVEDKGDLNVGLRLPAHVIGIDVDNYGGKSGKATLAAANDRWGRLPDTWVSTSRDDGTSGIRFYVVPEGLAWPSELPGGGVEIIREAHRYAMVYPSMHPEGRRYEWLDPEGEVARSHGDTGVPFADDLPDLPVEWIEGLTSGRAALDQARADLSDTEAIVWLSERGIGSQCLVMTRAVARACADMVAGGSRHDALTRGTARVAHLVQEGHSGGFEATMQLSAAFGGATSGERRTGEVDRAIAGAVRLAVAVGDVEPFDPCVDAFAAKRAGELDNGRRPEALIGSVTAMVPSSTEGVGASAANRSAQDPRTVQRDVFGDEGNLAPVVELQPASNDPAYDQLVAIEVTQQRARREAKRILDDAEHAANFREPPRTATLTTELALPDDAVTYRVAEILPTGGNVLFAAQYKTGKTTAITNLARAIADGGPFLGQLATSPLAQGERVAIWNYEVDRGQYRRWLRDAAFENTDRVTVLNLRGYRLPITVKRIEDWIVEQLIESNVRVWIVDPFARAFTGVSENDNTEVGRWLDAIDVIKERAGVRELVLPTHTGRAEMEEGRERARGATRLDDWADVRWILTKDESGQRFFSATGRDVEFDEKLVAYDDANRRMAIAGGSRAATRTQQFRNAVIAVVTNTPGVSSNAIKRGVRATGMRAGNDALNDAIAEAIEDGYLRTERVSQTTRHFIDETPKDVFK